MNGFQSLLGNGTQEHHLRYCLHLKYVDVFIWVSPSLGLVPWECCSLLTGVDLTALEISRMLPISLVSILFAWALQAAMMVFIQCPRGAGFVLVRVVGEFCLILLLGVESICSGQPL